MPEKVKISPVRERTDRRGSNSKRLLCVLDILKETDSAHPITQREIVGKLAAKYGVDAERKAVGRDIAALIECDYSIEQCTDNKLGWYYEQNFEDWELKVMTDAVRSAKFLDQSSTDKLTDKIIHLASPYSWDTLRLMSIPADAKRGDYSTKITIDLVMNAIIRCRKVHFDYIYTDDSMHTLPKHPGGTKPVSPYALVWRKDKYYLIGSYDDKSLSYYRMDRIHNIKELNERAVSLQSILGSDANRKLKEFVKKNVYNKKGRDIRLQLQLQLCSNSVDTVIDSFGDGVRVIKNPDGTLSAYVTVSDSEGLYTWLMHHAREAAVISPPQVREEMKRRLEKMLENYS